MAENRRSDRRAAISVGDRVGATASSSPAIGHGQDQRLRQTLDPESGGVALINSVAYEDRGPPGSGRGSSSARSHQEKASGGRVPGSETPSDPILILVPCSGAESVFPALRGFPSCVLALHPEYAFSYFHDFLLKKLICIK
jgi:hypothetical protein